MREGPADGRESGKGAISERQAKGQGAGLAVLRRLRQAGVSYIAPWCDKDGPGTKNHFTLPGKFTKSL